MRVVTWFDCCVYFEVSHVLCDIVRPLPSENLRWVCWRFEMHILDFRGMSRQLCWIAGNNQKVELHENVDMPLIHKVLCESLWTCEVFLSNFIVFCLPKSHESICTNNQITLTKPSRNNYVTPEKFDHQFPSISWLNYTPLKSIIHCHWLCTLFNLR